MKIVCSAKDSHIFSTTKNNIVFDNIIGTDELTSYMCNDLNILISNALNNMPLDAVSSKRWSSTKIISCTESQ